MRVADCQAVALELLFSIVFSFSFNAAHLSLLYS